MPRRTVLTAAMAGAAGALLSACGTPANPGNTPSTPGLDTATECVDLASHQFRRGMRYCTPAEPMDDSVDPSAMYPIDHFGRLTATADTLTAYYVNAVTEWSTTTGEVTAVLAPQRADSPIYATRGEFTVNPRCDATLIVQRAGCRVRELAGHKAIADLTPTDGIQDLLFVSDDTLASVGTDDTLRLWQVATPAEPIKIALPAASTARSLAFDPATNSLALVGQDTIQLFDPATLAARDTLDGLPASKVAWTPTPSGHWVGISADDANKGTLIWSSANGETQLVPDHDSPKVVAVSASGLVAAIVGYDFWLGRPDEQFSRVRLGKGAYQATSAAFSPDEQTLHVLDATRGIQSFEVASGASRLIYQSPRVA